MDFQIKIKGRLYTIEKITMGDMRLLRKHFNVTDLAEMNFGDPDVIAGLCYLALKYANPEWEHQRLVNFVDDLALDEVEQPEDEVEPDPKTRAW